MSDTPTLTRLRLYPVKSLRGVDRDLWELDHFGLRYDRRWMIVDPDGGFMTRRDHPEMAQVEVELHADRVELNAPQNPTVSFPLEPEPAPAEPVVVWKDTVAARPVAEDASRWLSEFLRTPCRLVYMPDETVRAVDPNYDVGSSRVAFTDGFPLLLLSEESMEELNRRMAEPMAIERFRPNLVVRGVAGPNAEDGWRRIRIGDVEMHVVKPCSRCVITATHPETGERGTEPLKTLATYRRREGEVWFGQNVIHASDGTVRVGEAVQVLETGDMPTFDAEDAAAEPPADEPPSDEDAGADDAPEQEAAAGPSFRVVAVREPKPDPESAPELVLAEPEHGDPGELDLAVEPASPANPPLELRFGTRPEPDAVIALYREAGRPETSGDPDLGRIERTLRASNVLASAWRGDELVAVVRAWTDGARDGFIADVVVHPDIADTGVAAEMIRRTAEAHPGVRWVLRPSDRADAWGAELGWTALGEGWWVGGAS